MLPPLFFSYQTNDNAFPSFDTASNRKGETGVIMVYNCNIHSRGEPPIKSIGTPQVRKWKRTVF